MKIVILNKSRFFGGRPINKDEPTPVSDDLAKLIVSNGWGEVDEEATTAATKAAAADVAKEKAKAAPRATKAKKKPTKQPTAQEKDNSK